MIIISDAYTRIKLRSFQNIQIHILKKCILQERNEQKLSLRYIIFQNEMYIKI